MDATRRHVAEMLPRLQVVPLAQEQGQMSYYVDIVEYNTGNIVRSLGPYVSKGEVADAMFTAQVGLNHRKFYARTDHRFTARPDAATDARRLQAVTSKRLGGAGLCGTTSHPETDGNNDVAAVKKNIRVRGVPGYHCPGCHAVFGTSAMLADHFRRNGTCQGAADYASIMASAGRSASCANY